MYHSPSIGMPCGPSRLYETVRSLSGLSNLRSTSKPSLFCQSRKVLVTTTPLGAVVRKTTSWPSSVDLRGGVFPAERADDPPLVVADDVPEHRVEPVLGAGGELGLGRSAASSAGSAAAWRAFCASGSSAERQRQGRRPDRVAADQLERPVRLDPALELGVEPRRADGLDAGALLLELDFQPVAGRRLVGASSPGPARRVRRARLRDSALGFVRRVRGGSALGGGLLRQDRPVAAFSACRVLRRLRGLCRLRRARLAAAALSGGGSRPSDLSTYGTPASEANVQDHEEETVSHYSCRAEP